MELFRFKQQISNYSFRQFAWFRIILGGYLLIHFIVLLPYAGEVFSNAGIFAEASVNPTYKFFPDVLYLADSPLFIYIFLAVLICLSLLLMNGYRHRIVSFLLWYGWACLLNRNNLIINPGIPYIGWLLLILCFVPEKQEDWKLPSWLFIASWVLMAAGYTISGLDKLQSPSWVNGDTTKILLENPLARDTFIRKAFLCLPDQMLNVCTWLILAAEILFLPLSIFSKTRKYAWLAMVLVHLGILVLVNFTDLTLGMLMIHVFTLDRKWWQFPHLPLFRTAKL